MLVVLSLFAIYLAWRPGRFAAFLASGGAVLAVLIFVTRNESPGQVKWREQNYGFGDRPSGDNALFEVQYPDIRLRMPRNYMIDYSAPQPMVPVPFLRIAATIPDFNGLSGKTLATFDTMVKIAAWWDAAPDNVVWAVVGNEGSTAAWNARPVAEAKTGRYRNSLDDLIEVPSVITDAGYHTFVHLSEHDSHNIVFNCHKIYSGGSNEICEALFDISETVAVSYCFNYAIIQNWRSIDDGMRSLLNRFVVRNH